MCAIHSGLKKMEEQHKVQAALMSSTHDVLQGGKLIFGELEVPSTKIPQVGRQNKQQLIPYLVKAQQEGKQGAFMAASGMAPACKLGVLSLPQAPLAGQLTKYLMPRC